MKKFYVGQKVFVGGQNGIILTISEINGDYLVLKNSWCSTCFHKGDCTLIPVVEEKWIQIPLFDL